MKKHWVGWAITAGAILTVSFFHRFGIFDVIELKVYDFRFNRVRGPLTGWTARDSSFIKRGTDIVLVEVDDETWRLIPEEWPYPRGTVWGRIVRNLYQAGAKVIVFDIQFDAPEAKSSYLHNFVDNLDRDFILSQIPQSRDTSFADRLAGTMAFLVPRHGDKMFGEAVAEAQIFGTKVVINTKKVTEQSLQPPQYIAYPVEEIMAAGPETGLINDMLDRDGFSRRYSLFDQLSHDPQTYYLTLGLKAVKMFENISDTAKPYFDPENLTFTYGGKVIPVHGYGNTFLVNYYGPASGYKVRSEKNIPAWGTFPKFSLAYILDTEDVTLKVPEEDIDWMSQFLPGKIPAWIMSIEDSLERKEMIEVLGLGEDFNIEKSPFYNKIIVIGTSVETHHDYKQTPFYNYLGIQQIMPGLETHANAIQTILDDNYLQVLGGKLTDLDYFPLSHGLLIAALSFLAFLILSMFNPLIAGILILLEGLVFFGVVCGLFMDDIFWLLKIVISFILPESMVNNAQSWLHIGLPGLGRSKVIPFVAPVASLFVTYTGNVIYKFLVEQKDKKFLKSTFGAYISPDLIDQMYSEKQVPQLGGQAGIHTAFFSDIQSFSSFSEVLEPEELVALMNEYLTEMTDILLDHKGTLDKYIGDAIVAFYGAPVAVENHEIEACNTALEMEKKLAELREKWAASGKWPDIVHQTRHRVGISTGKIVTGNMGSNMRMNYTMMGDTVNLAARLEPAAKQYGVYILVSEFTYDVVKDNYAWRFIDNVRVKGKKKPVKIFELLSFKEELSPANSKMVETFDRGVDFYGRQDWNKALKEFRNAEKMEEKFPFRPTTPSAVYIERCEYFKENNPGKDWDGVWVMTEK